MLILIFLFTQEVRNFSRGFDHVTFLNIIKVMVFKVKAVHNFLPVCEVISILQLQ